MLRHLGGTGRGSRGNPPMWRYDEAGCCDTLRAGSVSRHVSLPRSTVPTHSFPHSTVAACAQPSRIPSCNKALLSHLCFDENRGPTAAPAPPSSGARLRETAPLRPHSHCYWLQQANAARSRCLPHPHPNRRRTSSAALASIRSSLMHRLPTHLHSGSEWAQVLPKAPHQT